MKLTILLLSYLITLNIFAAEIPEKAYSLHKKAITEQVEGNTSEALRLFKMASELGENASTHNIGNIYFYGRGTVLKDYELAAKWYQKAAEQGFSPSQTNLANMYFHGKGVIQSNKNAYIWSTLSDNTKVQSSNTDRFAKTLSVIEIKEADKIVKQLYNKIYRKQ